MARPRTITDDRLFDAAAVVLARSGPAFTLADVAAEAGVAAGTVAGRFGSRAGLLRALSERNTEQGRQRIRAAAAAADTPLEALRAGLLAWAAPFGDPVAAANNVAALGEDLLDPQLRRLLGEHLAMVVEETRALLVAAHLPGAPKPARAARLLVNLCHGGALDWSIRPVGRLRTRLAQDIDGVVAGWIRCETR